MSPFIRNNYVSCSYLIHDTRFTIHVVFVFYKFVPVNSCLTSIDNFTICQGVSFDPSRFLSLTLNYIPKIL